MGAENAFELIRTKFEDRLKAKYEDANLIRDIMILFNLAMLDALLEDFKEMTKGDRT